MASPQTEKGYTMIANEILEALIRYDFPQKTSLPQRLCLFVIRQTYGFHKKDDIISLTQFQKAINEKNRTNLVYWLNYLVQARILAKTKLKNNQIKWHFIKDYDQWLPLVQVRTLVQARKYNGASTNTTPSASTDTKTSASTDTHKRKKDIIKEITKETATAKAVEPINQIFEIFYRTINPTINFANSAYRKACDTLISKIGLEKSLNAAKYAVSIQNQKYAPTITNPLQLANRYGELQAYFAKNNLNSQKESKTLIL